MSFLTEYFDEFREYPIRKRPPCSPEDRWVKLKGKWQDPKKIKGEEEPTEEEIKEFIKKTMRNLRGQSTYFNEYCAHLDQSFKTRPFVPRVKQRFRKTTATEDKEEQERLEKEMQAKLPQKLALKDTEVMKKAQELYERDLDESTLPPLATHARILSYVRPRLYHTGLSEYQDSICRVAYELVRDNRIPKYQPPNGGKPKWGYPPEGTRQPMLDGVPFDGERIYN